MYRILPGWGDGVDFDTSLIPIRGSGVKQTTRKVLFNSKGMDISLSTHLCLKFKYLHVGLKYIE